MESETESGSSGISGADMDEQLLNAVTEAITGSNDKVVEIRPARQSDGGGRRLPLLVLLAGMVAVAYWLRAADDSPEALRTATHEIADRTELVSERTAERIQAGGETLADRVEEGSQKASEAVEEKSQKAGEAVEEGGERAAERAATAGEEVVGDGSSDGGSTGAESAEGEESDGGDGDEDSTGLSGR